jgi:DNA-binding transcriptional MerR regulator
MPRQTSPIDARLAELREVLLSLTSALKQIDEAIAALQQQIESEPAMAEDAEYVDRMTTEVGRQRIVTKRRAEVEAEIARLVASQEE